jgi:hypothetical protein
MQALPASGQPASHPVATASVRQQSSSYLSSAASGPSTLLSAPFCPQTAREKCPHQQKKSENRERKNVTESKKK